MRHGVKKIKFNYGRDSNRMLMRKLAANFLAHGYLVTTITKTKVLRSHLEKLVSKMKVRTEANKNHLLKYFGDSKLVENGFKVIGPAIAKVNGGYVRIIRLNQRQSDGSIMARIEWAYPVVLEKVVKQPVKLVKAVEKSDEKSNKTDKTS